MIAAFLAGDLAQACPVFLTAGDIKDLPQSQREQLRLFALSKEPGTNPTWQQQPLQVAPLDEEGLLPQEGNISEMMPQPWGEFDRLSFPRDGFGDRFSGQTALPCGAKQLIELQSPVDNQAYAYLVACEVPQADQKFPVGHQPEKNRIWSSIFDYYYVPTNQLQFSRMMAEDPVTGRRFHAVGDANIKMRLDIKNFFTIEMTNDDVLSFVENTQQGSVGLLGRIQFYFKLMMFKIDLSLATLAGWFEDSSNIPAIIDIPVDAPDYLNNGSGFTFTWRVYEVNIEPDGTGARIVKADKEEIRKGWEHLAKRGMEYCEPGASQCLFRLPGKIGTSAFTVDMLVARDLVERGFYPQWISDMNEFQRDLEWIDEDDVNDGRGRSGFFYNTDGLLKGRHKMDYWIRLGDASAESCPRTVNVLGPVDAKTPRAILTNEPPTDAVTPASAPTPEPTGSATDKAPAHH